MDFSTIENIGAYYKIWLDGIGGRLERKFLNLFENGKLRCPKEKKLRDILEYGRMGIVKEFDSELNVILRCVCGHIFSPIGYQEINKKDG